MSRVHSGLIRATALVAIAGGVACADGPDESGRLLPGAAHTTVVPTGDPAGPAERGAARIENPYADDPLALRDGELLYRQMNCADCHRYSGAGGMGPSLIDGEWLFGDTPVDRFMTVHGGQARGMPAYGHLLPDESIWKIVAYIDALGQKSGEPGRAAGEAPGAARQAQGPQGGRH